MFLAEVFLLSFCCVTHLYVQDNTEQIMISDFMVTLSNCQIFKL